MTANTTLNGTETAKRGRLLSGWATSVLFLLGMLLAAGMLSEEIGRLAYEGLALAVTKVIPTALPFMILSDLYMAYGRPERIKPLARIFSLVFGLPEPGLRSFVSGNICGFPIGVMTASDMYRAGIMEKGDCERLMAYSNNPSSAFIIGAVGMGMYGSATDGIKLYAAVLLSVVAVGLIFRKKTTKQNISCNIPRQTFNFVESVKRSGASSVTVISFISVFSVIGGLISMSVEFFPVRALSSALLEVTGGVYFFSSATQLSPPLSFALTAFTLAFGGISVMLQSASFTRGCDLSIRRYFIIKLVQGVTAALIAGLIYLM